MKNWIPKLSRDPATLAAVLEREKRDMPAPRDVPGKVEEEVWREFSASV